MAELLDPTQPAGVRKEALAFANSPLWNVLDPRYGVQAGSCGEMPERDLPVPPGPAITIALTCFERPWLGPHEHADAAAFQKAARAAPPCVRAHFERWAQYYVRGMQAAGIE